MEVAQVRKLYLEELQVKMRKRDQTHVPVKKQNGLKEADQRALPKDNQCGRNHHGKCRVSSWRSGSFKYGKLGHISRGSGVALKLKFQCYQSGYFMSQSPKHAGTTVQALLPITLWITNSILGKKNGAQTSQGRPFSLLRKRPNQQQIFLVDLTPLECKNLV